MPVFGTVDILGLCPEDGDALGVELQGKVIRDLPTSGEDDPSGSL